VINPKFVVCLHFTNLQILPVIDNINGQDFCIWPERIDLMSEDQREDHPEPTYQDELSDAVDDGGGCAETWEATSTNRRKFLKAGAGTLALATLGAGNAFAEATSTSSIAAQDDTQYQELNQQEAKNIQQSFTRRPEFHALTSKAEELGFRVDPDKSVIGKATSKDSNDRILMSTPLAGDNADQAYITMGATTSGSLVIATLEYMPSDTKLTTIDALDGLDSQTRKIPDPRTSDTIDLSQGSITTSSAVTCTGCQAAVGLICQIGCHVGTAFLCGVLTGAGYIAGAACFVFTRYACATIAIFGCGGLADYQKICEEMGAC
jgi:halocin C8-like bacteriocin domain-containing protein